MITPISPEGAHATRCSAVTDAVIQRAVTRRAAALKGNSRADARDAVATPIGVTLAPRPAYLCFSSLPPSLPPSLSLSLSLFLSLSLPSLFSGPRRSRIYAKPVMRLDLYELPRSRSPDSDIFRWRNSSPSLHGGGLIAAAPLSSPSPSPLCARSILSRLFSLPFAPPPPPPPPPPLRSRRGRRRAWQYFTITRLYGPP